MVSTSHTTIAARASQCLAATAFMAGLTIGTAATAGAEPVWDVDKFDRCLVSNGKEGMTEDEFNRVYWMCCAISGGESGSGSQENKCVAPAAQNVPGEPGQTTPPPVLQNPPQTSNPLIPSPRGPNSGTVG
jgi:hypothetical protein